MHEDIVLLLKGQGKRTNQLDDRLYELQKQYDKMQYELRCIKGVLQEVCQTAVPHRTREVRELLENHDKMYRTWYGGDGSPPLATIRFGHQVNRDLGSSYSAVWNTFL